MTQAITNYGALIAAIAATVGLLGWLSHATRRMHRSADTVDRVARLLQPDDNSPGLAERLRVLEERTARIEAELHPNGGRTARDAIIRMERRLDELTGRPPANPS
ncbi:hypothetical protein [Streptacidiphilus rugosus]|uniref:hypothetical protein n=1 Tax=Streptacidiphilus rugosus TaxID=405783 RepID=UPI00055C156D|nr:hypothetical protein [Streptacidiphilus rugosus]